METMVVVHNDENGGGIDVRQLWWRRRHGVMIKYIGSSGSIGYFR